MIYINNVEEIQRIFTNKIDGMEDLNYHEGLRDLTCIDWREETDID